MNHGDIIKARIQLQLTMKYKHDSYINLNYLLFPCLSLFICNWRHLIYRTVERNKINDANNLEQCLVHVSI